MPFSNLLNKVVLSVLFETDNNYQSSRGTVQNYLDEKPHEHLKHFRELNELFEDSENSADCDYYTPH